MYLVIVYDIATNRRRRKLSRHLDGLLRRVQKSVFEGRLPNSVRSRLEALICDTIDHRRDTVRVYHLCKRCRERVELHGASPPVPDGPRDVVLG